MKAIILAAGIGSRLKEKGRALPKCLIKVGKETLLERQIRIFNDLNINDVILVIGYQGGCWTKENIEKIKKINKKIVINKKNIELKRPYSLFGGLNAIEKDDVITTDSDCIFKKELIKKVMDDNRKNLILASYIESRNFEGGGAKIITGNKEKVVKIGYGFSSNKLFSTIFKIGSKDFDLFKQMFARKENWNKKFSIVLQKFLKQVDCYALTVNTSLSVIPKKEVEATESWKPTEIWVEKRGNVIKKKTRLGRKKLINEINFILSLPENVKKHFPRVIDHNFKEEVVHYDMVYCPYPSFIDLIFEKKISVKESLKILKIIFDFVFNTLYKIKIKQTPVGFISDSYFNKIKQRFNAVDKRFSLFKKVASSDSLIINGRKLKNFNIIINEIKKDIKFLASLEPPFVTTYHGDFKFDNMLVNLKTNDFVLIDPRGKTAAGYNESDIIEDIAKLFTSCHGYYDIFRRNLFDIKFKENEEIYINYKLKSSETIDFFGKITTKLMQLLPNYDQIKNDNNWKKRLFFIEAILLIANAPSHLKSKEGEDFSIALLIRGVELLNNFIDKYPLNKDKKFDIININIPEDYKRAKNFFDWEV